ncbi:SDR family NAD(P)-dependent oxidoreductase [Patescibacteria group bacterium]
MDLKGKVVVITGASSGLGKALALRLCKEQPKLVLLSRSADKLQDVVEKVKESKCSVSSFSCNVTDLKQMKHTIEYILEAYGQIDVLVNNAGILYEAKIENYQPLKLLELFDVNAIGAISMIQLILPHMREKNYGQIINVISTAGIQPAKHSSVYNATKFALEGFTRSLKLDLDETNIKVMGFYPGGMEANLFTTQKLADNKGPFQVEKETVADVLCFMMKAPDIVSMDHVEVKKFGR